MPAALTSSSARRVSLRDVAQAVGVSHVAVSLALRGDARVSAVRREEIAAAAERLGYRPDPMLASLAAYRNGKRATPISATIAWINQWPDPKALRRLREFDAYWRGAARAATELGYRLEEFAIGGDLTAERLQTILTARGVRGLIIPPHAHGLALEGFEWARYSVIRLGFSVPTPHAHAVGCDQVECGALAYTHTHAQGYRRIGFVSSPRFDRNTTGNFRAGYLRRQEDLAPPAQRLGPLLVDEAVSIGSTDPLRAWLERERPDAVITTNHALRALLAKISVRVPRDLGVATTSVFDGNFPAGIDQNCEEIGAVAMRTLAGLIHRNERGIPAHSLRILVPGVWVDGASLPGVKKSA